MTIRRGASNLIKESDDRRRNFERMCIASEHRMANRLAAFVFHPLKRTSWRAPDKGEDFSHD